MRNTIENEVIHRFSEYEALLIQKKISKHDYFMLMDGVGPKRDWNFFDLSLQHINGKLGSLLTEQSKRKSTKYRIILFVKDFAIEPLCRFDSDGNAHENVFINMPLVTRKVETPHFHQYSSAGVMYAFKTPYLITHEKEVKEDIQKGLDEMCNIYNIFTDANKAPYLMDTKGFIEMIMGKEIDDLHKEIKFPI